MIENRLRQGALNILADVKEKINFPKEEPKVPKIPAHLAMKIEI